MPWPPAVRRRPSRMVTSKSGDLPELSSPQITCGSRRPNATDAWFRDRARFPGRKPKQSARCPQGSWRSHAFGPSPACTISAAIAPIPDKVMACPASDFLPNIHQMTDAGDCLAGPGKLGMLTNLAV